MQRIVQVRHSIVGSGDGELNGYRIGADERKSSRRVKVVKHSAADGISIRPADLRLRGRRE